jgi:sec-independent protein translocase protein TatA
MPGSIGWQGLVIILIVLLLVFGPKRLPEMGRSLGRGMREFKESVTGRGDDDDEFDRRPPEITPGDDTQAVRTRSSTAREHDV